MIYSTGYDSRYEEGVIQCLIRNGYKENGLRQWFRRVTSFSSDELALEQYPYRNGMVIFDNEKIVGFLGAIMRPRTINNQQFTFLNCTTWAIDKPYRVLVFKYASKLFAYGDIITDDTARASMRAVFAKMKMQEYDNKCYLLYPVPYIGASCLEIHETKDGENLCDLNSEVFNLYRFQDMFPETHLFQIREKKSGRTEYLYYKSKPQPERYGVILYTSDGFFVSRYLHEIIWDIFYKLYYTSKMDKIVCSIIQSMKENKKICIECDSRFVDGKICDYPLFKEKQVHRLVKSPIELNNADLHFLYSELAVL